MQFFSILIVSEAEGLGATVYGVHNLQLCCDRRPEEVRVDECQVQPQKRLGDLKPQSLKVPKLFSRSK